MAYSFTRAYWVHQSLLELNTTFLLSKAREQMRYEKYDPGEDACVSVWMQGRGRNRVKYVTHH